MQNPEKPKENNGQNRGEEMVKSFSIYLYFPDSKKNLIKKMQILT